MHASQLLLAVTPCFVLVTSDVVEICRRSARARHPRSAALPPLLFCHFRAYCFRLPDDVGVLMEAKPVEFVQEMPY